MRAAIDRRRYPIGKEVTEKQIRELNIERHAPQGRMELTVRQNGCYSASTGWPVLMRSEARADASSVMA